MSKRTVYNEVSSKIESMDLSVRETRELLVRTLRGRLDVGVVSVQIVGDLYDRLTSLAYIDLPTNKDFISRFIKASLHHSLVRAGYDNPESIYNAEEFNKEIHEVLLAADFACDISFEASIYFHILPSELGHPQPVSLFFHEDFHRDELTVDGVHYSVRSDERYTLTDSMVDELEAMIVVHSAMSDMTIEIDPCSMRVELHFWPKSGIDFLDVVLWDGLFSYNTDILYGWLSTIPEFI